MDNLAVYRRLAELLQMGARYALATVVDTKGAAPRHQGAKMIVLSDGTSEGTVGGGKLEAMVIREALRCIRQGQSELMTISLTESEGGIGTVCGGKATVFIEVVSAGGRLFIFGGGHVGGALARIAAACGMNAVVYDDRPDRLDELKGEGIATVCGSLERIGQVLSEASMPMEGRDIAVIVTRGHAYDAEVLYQLLEMPERPWYIGMIGSREKVSTCFGQLRSRGVAESLLSGVKTPIGLDIGAETPEEIAISILAEIIAFSKLAQGKTLRFTPLSSHCPSASPAGSPSVASDRTRG